MIVLAVHAKLKRANYQRHTMLILDPTTLSTQNKGYQDQLEGLLYLLKGTISPFIPEGTYDYIRDGKRKKIIMVHSLLVRSGESDCSKKRIEVFSSDCHEKGHTGLIFDSIGVLVPENSYQFKPLKPHKARLCKVILFDKIDIEYIAEEHKMLRKLEEFHVKPLAYNSEAAFILMRKVGDYDLFEIIERHHKKIEKLTTLGRLHLSLAVLKAYEQQILKQNLLHRDIKPENIVIRKKTLEAIYIDYAFACTLEDIGCKEDFVGTIPYLAPEVIVCQQYSTQSDLFALGRTLAQIWGDSSTKECSSSANKEEILVFHKKQQWVNLFEDTDLGDEYKKKILKILNGLTCFDNNKRINLPTAINTFTEIEYEYRIGESLPSPSKNKNRAFLNQYLFFSETKPKLKRSQSLPLINDSDKTYQF